MTANLTKESLLISFIRTDGGTQNRAALDLDMVAEYQAAMQQGATFPPVQVFYDGQGYWLWDGFHRVEAARRAGLTSIASEINTGTQQDAVMQQEMNKLRARILNKAAPAPTSTITVTEAPKPAAKPAPKKAATDQISLFDL